MCLNVSFKTCRSCGGKRKDGDDKCDYKNSGALPKAAEMLVGQTYNGMVANKMIIMKLFIKKENYDEDVPRI